MIPRRRRSQGDTDGDIRMCILVVWAYGWISYPTSLSHEGYQSVEVCSYQADPRQCLTEILVLVGASDERL